MELCDNGTAECHEFIAGSLRHPEFSIEKQFILLFYDIFQSTVCGFVIKIAKATEHILRTT